MKPYQLIAALMHEQGLGALPLAKKMGKPKLQPQIHRFANGQVMNPARTTAKPLADFFDIPLDAIYDEVVATRVARERNVRALPASPRRPPRPPRIGKRTLRVVELLTSLSPTESQELVRILRGRPELPHLGDVENGLAPFKDPHGPTKKAKK